MSHFIDLTIVEESAGDAKYSIIHIDPSMIKTIERATLKLGENRTIACAKILAVAGNVVLHFDVKELPDIVATRVEQALAERAARSILFIRSTGEVVEGGKQG